STDAFSAPRLSEIRDLAQSLDVHRAIIAPGWRADVEPRETLNLVRTLKAVGVRVSVLPRKLEVVGSSAEFDDLHGVTPMGVPRVGRFLRRTALDELPQLLNIVAGEMSLVGPRPLVIEEDRRVQGWHRRRLELMPGMTGPWQILGPARVPLKEMVALDYLYVANWSLWTDVKILLRTVPHVLGRRGL